MLNILILLLKTYVWLVLLHLSIIATLSILCVSNWKIIVKYHYHLKMALYIVILSWASIFLTPYFLIRPRRLTNPSLITKIAWPFVKYLGLEVEIQNAKILSENTGAVVCLNHQSFLDNLVLGQMLNCVPKSIFVSKLELKYICPTLWLLGNYFVDRKNPKQAYATLGEVVKILRLEKTNMYYFPEGTRNPNVGFHKFRRGAFKAAIMGQLPIIPVAVSHYSFLDHEKKTFKKGRIVCKVLEPISTIGMEESDHEALMEKTRNRMLEEYEKLNAQAK